MEATETRRPLVFGLGISMISIAFLFVSIRFYCRTVLIRALGFDDLFILLATFALISYTALLFFGTYRFLGHHIWDRAFMAQMEENTQSNLVTLSICAFLTIIIMTCTIISTLMTYLRLFEDRLNRWFCYSIMTFTVSFSVLSIVIFSILISAGKFFIVDPTGKINPTVEIVIYTSLCMCHDWSSYLVNFFSENEQRQTMGFCFGHRLEPSSTFSRRNMPLRFRLQTDLRKDVPDILCQHP
ncbi:hypothetical protein BS50DRAFT_632249 [Corynespora cassiicola Philippines]|uniref:Rhodopsin domain-containing protein n=1 Tax=Corynespora cassiicola Philippines TaxID=1448308 RepID=A0A2T2NY53_CORCC|nr:hypothetical protein BS50DRAFT_632249 [Corynespora cassiicola Philippines]